MASKIIIAIKLPLKPRSLNKSLYEHWSKTHRIAKKQRETTHLALKRKLKGVLPPVIVTLTRIAPRPLDGDNLQGSFKHIRDGVADALRLDDADSRITWSYAQERGKPKEYAVMIEIETR